MLCLESLRSGLHRAFVQDPNVVLLGEDIADPYGGAFKVTQGLSEAFPDRVYPTPISESAIVGLCTGLALRGLRPVGEIMFGDFLTLCTDQIVNSAAKFPLMYNQGVQVPWVLRSPVAGMRGYGPTHSQSLEKMFFGVPGLEVLAPSRLHDAGEMLRQAVLTGIRPTLFIEDKGDYPKPLISTNDGPLRLHGALDSDPAGNRVVTNHSLTMSSTDLQIVAYGGAASMAAEVLAGLAKEEIYGILHAVARVNDPLTLMRTAQALEPDIPLLIVEQGTEGFGWASELIARRITAVPRETCPPVRILAARAVAIPAAPRLEREIVVTAARIETALMEMLA